MDEKCKSWKILRKFCKTFRKLGKMHYFSIFQKNFNKPCVNFFEFGRKTQIVGKFWENLLKIFIKKWQKMNYFSIFSIEFNKPCLNFLRVWSKMTIYWKFWENFPRFWKFFFRKLQEMHYFSIFFKQVNKLCVHFLRVWTKNTNYWEILKFFDKNSLENLNFLFFIFFRKFVTKNRAFGNNTIFYNKFFGFGGGGDFPLSPLAMSLLVGGPFW